MTKPQKYLVSFIDDLSFYATSPEDAALAAIEFISNYGDQLRLQVNTSLESVIVEPQFIDLDDHGNPIINGCSVERFGGLEIE